MTSYATDYALPALITLLTVLLMFGTAMNVGRCRGKYKVAAPAMTGDPVFERAFRVQMNTLEYAAMFIPALWLFAVYTSVLWSGILGVAWLLGRVLYWKGYMEEAKKRGAGYGISFFALIGLMLGALVGIVLKMV